MAWSKGTNFRATSPPLYLVRNLFGKVSVSASESLKADDSCRKALQDFSRSLQEKLGAHSYSAEDAVLFVESELLETLEEGAKIVRPGVYWVDRLVTGHGLVDSRRSAPRGADALHAVFGQGRCGAQHYGRGACMALVASR